MIWILFWTNAAVKFTFFSWYNVHANPFIFGNCDFKSCCAKLMSTSHNFAFFFMGDSTSDTSITSWNSLQFSEIVGTTSAGKLSSFYEVTTGQAWWLIEYSDMNRQSRLDQFHNFPSFILIVSTKHRDFKPTLRQIWRIHFATSNYKVNSPSSSSKEWANSWNSPKNVTNDIKFQPIVLLAATA